MSKSKWSGTIREGGDSIRAAREDFRDKPLIELLRDEMVIFHAASTRQLKQHELTIWKILKAKIMEKLI